MSKMPQIIRDPIYQQLHGLLRDLVLDGEIAPGSQFLTEREVGARYGVSRITANKALASLVTEGLLEFRKGVGTFVRPGALDTDLRSLVSFTHRALSLGHQPDTKVLDWSVLPVPSLPVIVAKALEVGSKETVYRVERLRLADNEPVIHEVRYIRSSACPGLEPSALSGSFYSLLKENYGLRITGAEQTIRAIPVAKQVARLLGIATGSAALQVQATGYAGARPVWWEETLYRGDRYEFQNQLGRQPLGQPARVQLRKPQPDSPK